MKEKVRCVECGHIQHHPIHEGYGYEHDFEKPVKKARRQPIAHHSEKMQDYYDEVRIPEVIAAQGTPCEARISDLVPVVWKCSGVAEDIHEILSRSQAGGLKQAVEFGTMKVCRRCHDWITDHPKEAMAMGFRETRKSLGLDKDRKDIEL